MMHITTTKSSATSCSLPLILVLLVALSINNHCSVVVRAFQQRYPATTSTTTAQHNRCSSYAFAFSGRSASQSRSFFASSSSDNDNDSNDDEIAKLEEQLKKLKEEKGVVAATPPAKDNDGEEEEELMEEASMDMFLSEGWKEAKTNYDPSNTATKTRQAEEQGSLVGTALKVVGAIVALVLFSQIPVGQEDLSKYSAIKSGPATTTIDLGDVNRVKGQGGSDL